VGDSKCSTLHTESTAVAPVGLPVAWFDNATRWNQNLSAGGLEESVGCADSFSVAMAWCTGTIGVAPGAVSVGVWATEHDQTCPGPTEPVTYAFGEFDYREAVEIDEGENFNDPNWVFPMVTARDTWTNFAPGNDPCDVSTQKVTTKFDSDIQNEIRGINGTDVPLSAYTNLYLAGPEFPRCGIRQRRWWANESRPELAEEIGLDPQELPPPTFNPSTGYESLDIVPPPPSSPFSEMSMIREQRRFYGGCSDGSTCNAGGECVAGELPSSFTLVSVSVPPPPPTLAATASACDFGACHLGMADKATLEGAQVPAALAVVVALERWRLRLVCYSGVGGKQAWFGPESDLLRRTLRLGGSRLGGREPIDLVGRG
jgi:hypothetical protein